MLHAPPARDETARRMRHYRLRPRPQAVAVRRTGYRGTMPTWHDSQPHAVSAPRPTVRRAARESARLRGVRDRYRPPPAPAHKVDAAAQAKRCVARLRKEPLVLEVPAAAPQPLRAGREFRSMHLWANLRLAIRDPVRRNRSRSSVHVLARARRRARQDAAKGYRRARFS